MHFYKYESHLLSLFTLPFSQSRSTHRTSLFRNRVAQHPLIANTLTYGSESERVGQMSFWSVMESVGIVPGLRQVAPHLSQDPSLSLTGKQQRGQYLAIVLFLGLFGFDTPSNK